MSVFYFSSENEKKSRQHYLHIKRRFQCASHVTAAERIEMKTAVVVEKKTKTKGDPAKNYRSDPLQRRSQTNIQRKLECL